MGNYLHYICIQAAVVGCLIALAPYASPASVAHDVPGVAALVVLAATALFATIGVLLIRLERSRASLRRIEQDLAERCSELEVLEAIGRAIVATLDPRELYAAVDRECRKVFDVDVCCVMLVDPGDRRLKIAYARRRDGQELTPADREEPTLAAWVVEELRGRRIEDLGSPAESGLVGLDRGSRSAIAAPLVVDGRASGALLCESRRPDAFQPRHLSLLRTIARQVAVAIENAGNYRQATVDSLTGLFLRDYFFRRIDEEDQRVRRYGGSFAILMLDLDGFKQINDRNGHPIGDRFLGEIAETVRAQLRAADVGCRYGGDEFCILLPATELEGARSIAERIRSAVSARIVAIEGVALRSTVSIGVAVFPDHDAGDLRGLIRNADEALYRAKRSGRDRVVPYAA